MLLWPIISAGNTELENCICKLVNTTIQSDGEKCYMYLFGLKNKLPAKDDIVR